MDKYFIQDNLPFVLIVAGVFNLVILYLIIAAATQSKKRALYAWAQLELLAKIARAQGVPEDEIRATFDAIK